jgi:hypothetical protein
MLKISAKSEQLLAFVIKGLKTHNSLTSKEKLGVVSHICIYKINNRVIKALI